jgi:hypothetical protein
MGLAQPLFLLFYERVALGRSFNISRATETQIRLNAGLAAWAWDAPKRKLSEWTLRLRLREGAPRRNRFASMISASTCNRSCDNTL